MLSFGSLQSFLSIVRSKYIGHNTCTGRRRNFRSESKPIHEPAHESELYIRTQKDTSVGYHKHFLKDMPNIFHRNLVILILLFIQLLLHLVLIK